MDAFIRNMWYVAAWSHELEVRALLPRQIIGEPIVLFRGTSGAPVVFEDRCPHRMAPLSAGRLEGDELRCMYHGLRFNQGGRCVAVPASDTVPPRLNVRVYPAVERSSWIWVWMGDPARADESLIPLGWGLDDPEWHLKGGALDYDADYQLIHDNLLDLSHLDYVHETTLGAATGARWSLQLPEVRAVPRGLYVKRWMPNARPVYRPDGVDTHTSYYFMLPGAFLQTVKTYPIGSHERERQGLELPEPTFVRVDQQAVTPVAPGKARYYYAAGVNAKYGDGQMAQRLYEAAIPAFAQDKAMIEAQARVQSTTDPGRRMAYIPVDQAPTMFRRLYSELRTTELPAS